MKTTLRWVASNVGLILLSLFLALLVWAAAVEEGNPTSERRFATRIPVTIVNTPPEMIAYGYEPSDPQVYVTLRAPQSIWQTLEREDLEATVDLSGLPPGQHRLPIHVQVAREPVMVRQVDPEMLTLQLEYSAENVVPVDLRVAGNTALGYLARNPETNTLTATVRGPASLVEQVVEVVAQVSVEGRRADVVEEITLEPRDIEGAVIPYVTLVPNTISARVPVEQLSGFRDLAVTAVLDGQVASGYRVSSIKVEPPVVTVYGPPDTISQIPGYLETAPLDINNVQADLEFQTSLVAPEGVSLLPPVVTVRISIQPEEGSRTVERRVEIQGLGQPGITATVAPASVQLLLSGPLPMLEQLREEDLRVIVELAGLSPGSHSIEPQVIVPTGLLVESILPTNVQVEISTRGTPTVER